ncbi:hypothetical protein ON010_g3719 [Phytophthora cinnamomi]|nr:hypothetical protein ON010_g3719 [Phytophthora cinnamomi]
MPTHWMVTIKQAPVSYRHAQQSRVEQRSAAQRSTAQHHTAPHSTAQRTGGVPVLLGTPASLVRTERRREAHVFLVQRPVEVDTNVSGDVLQAVVVVVPLLEQLAQFAVVVESLVEPVRSEGRLASLFLGRVEAVDIFVAVIVHDLVAAQEPLRVDCFVGSGRLNRIGRGHLRQRRLSRVRRNGSVAGDEEGGRSHEQHGEEHHDGRDGHHQRQQQRAQRREPQPRVRDEVGQALHDVGGHEGSGKYAEYVRVLAASVAVLLGLSRDDGTGEEG